MKTATFYVVCFRFITYASNVYIQENFILKTVNEKN